MNQDNFVTQIDSMIRQLRDMHGKTTRDTAKFIMYAISALKSAESNLTHFDDNATNNREIKGRRVRNPEATCVTCPYFWVSGNNQFRECRKKSAAITTAQSSFPQVSEYDWCAEHPDFWEEA